MARNFQPCASSGQIIVDDDRHPSRVALQQSGVLTVTTSPNFAGKWLVHRLGRFVEAQADIEALLRTRPNGIAPPTARLNIAELAKISKVEKVEDNLDNPPKPRSQEPRC